MEPLITHLQAYGVYYALGAVIVLPILYLTRRWSLSLIQWGVELCIYATIMHVVIHYIVAIAEWFNYESQMKMLKDERVHLGWETPLAYFWRRDEYNPTWIFWLEVIFLCVAVYLMYRWRPMITQKASPKREVLRKGHAPRVRPPGRR